MDMVSRARKKLGAEAAAPDVPVPCPVSEEEWLAGPSASQEGFSGKSAEAKTVALPAATWRKMNAPSAIPLPPMGATDIHLLRGSGKAVSVGTMKKLAKKGAKKQAQRVAEEEEEEEEERLLLAHCAQLRADIGQKLAEASQQSLASSGHTQVVLCSQESESGASDSAAVRVSTRDLLDALERDVGDADQETQQQLDDDMCSQLLQSLTAKIAK